jgi:tetratricopeptide (TPR) repeat protein
MSSVPQAISPLGPVGCRRRCFPEILSREHKPIETSLIIREEALGRDNPDVATSLNNLANPYQNQGRYADAEPLYQRSLAIREKALGGDHPTVAQSLNNLAELYHRQGRNADAEPLYQRSLAIWEKALGRDHPNVATSLNKLGSGELFKTVMRYLKQLPGAPGIAAESAAPHHPNPRGGRSALAG